MGTYFYVNVNMYRWKFSALTSAACLCAALASTNAAALALGSVSVQSYLGQPLRALVDVPELSAGEASSLQIEVPSSDVFQAHGLEYGETARTLQIQLQRRTDGSAKLQLSTSAPVNEAFVHLIVQANWKTEGYAGNLMRSYTLLLDPAPTPHSAKASTKMSAGSPARIAPAAQAPVAAASNTGHNGSSVTVRPGDTAGRIAGAHRLEGVSLEQILVAMLQRNPRAFIRGNVNRIRAGALIQLPSQEEAQSTSPQEARQIIAAHHRNFAAARKRPATHATR